jgi:UDP-N-acetylenolpyruvoylglucosamine reductase
LRGGASGILVSSTARDNGIAGMEFLRSIPGTVGGFVRMNGGAYGGEVKDILVDCDVVLRNGDLVTLPVEDAALQLSPFSELPEGAIVVGARFRGKPGEARRDPGRNGPHLRQPRSLAAAAFENRRVDLQEPRWPQGMAAGR